VTLKKYDDMTINDLRRYVLNNRADIEAFHAYIDRSKAEGRMSSINVEEQGWQKEVDKRMPSFHHPQEQDFWDEEVEVETATGQISPIQIYLLRIYPNTFNGYDAYMDMPIANNPDIKKVRSLRLGKTWEVITGPSESYISGFFRGDYSQNNPPAWVFGLREIT